MQSFVNILRTFVHWHTTVKISQFKFLLCITISPHSKRKKLLMGMFGQIFEKRNDGSRRVNRNYYNARGLIYYLNRKLCFYVVVCVIR